VRVGTELDRLAAVRPQILQRTEAVVDAAEEDRILRDILTSAAAPRPGSAGPPGRRRHTAGLLTGGLGLAAAAMALAVVLSTGIVTAPGGHVAATHHGVARLSARQVLLAAASAAAARPEGSGTYWYVKRTYAAPSSRQTEETWTTRDGRTSWAEASYIRPTGRIVKWPAQRPGWSLLMGDFGPLIPFPPLLTLPSLPVPRKLMLRHIRGEHPSSGGIDMVSFAQLQSLPTSPAALKARLTTLTRNRAVLDGHAALFESLINLVTGLPAPPRVRAAAFQVLATLPIVIKVVTIHGLPGLRLSTSRFSWLPHATLVVNPATSQVQAVVNAEGSSASLTASWVNQIP
jgi:hypothetical protein